MEINQIIHRIGVGIAGINYYVSKMKEQILYYALSIEGKCRYQVSSHSPSSVVVIYSLLSFLRKKKKLFSLIKMA
jgi:hypothetical protein